YTLRDGGHAAAVDGVAVDLDASRSGRCEWCDENFVDHILVEDVDGDVVDGANRCQIGIEVETPGEAEGIHDHPLFVHRGVVAIVQRHAVQREGDIGV